MRQTLGVVHYTVRDNHSQPVFLFQNGECSLWLSVSCLSLNAGFVRQAVIFSSQVSELREGISETYTETMMKS